MNSMRHRYLPSSRLVALLEAIAEPALLIDIDRKILAANREFGEAFLGSEDPVGRQCFDVLHGRDSVCSLADGDCPLRQCLSERKVTRAFHVHKSGSGEAHTEIEMRPLLDQDGEIDSLLQIVRPLRVTSATANRDRLVGRSPAFLRLLKDLHRIGPTNKPVMVVGEPGSGKELVAQTLHQLSPRAQGPFVPVDCSSLHEWQFERELLGHVAGAFPGASESNPGFIGAAAEGTLLLDEISALAGSLQPKLQRLLDRGFYYQEGGTEPRAIDCRLICTTEHDLRDLVEAKTFRDELRLQLSVFPIEVPPLRQRIDDLPLLIESLLLDIDTADRCGGLSRAALHTLERCSFPGNVRELRGILERACLMAEGGLIEPEHLPPDCHGEAAQSQPLELRFDGDVIPLNDLDGHYIEWAASKLRCNHRDLARILGISERTLYRKLSRQTDLKH